MIFEKHLIHRCSISVPGDSGETDPYGRPIDESTILANVHCRSDQIRSRESRDESGVDTILTNALFFGPGTVLTQEMKVMDIQDKEGSIILPGTFAITGVFAVYGRRSLHHFEVTLRKE